MIWPDNTLRTSDGTLAIGGMRLDALAREFGTPLYVFDEQMIRARCRLFRDWLGRVYPESGIAYAGKAWLSTALLELIAEEGLDLDVVSAGELYVALASGFPANRIALHGNNKSRAEIEMAINAGIKHIVVDNDEDLRLLSELAPRAEHPVSFLLRVNPGIDVHTHEYRKTGIVDSKFGLGIESDDAERAVARLCEIPNALLSGYHAHIGSQIFEYEPYVDLVGTLFGFAATMRDRYGVVPSELSPGGGFAIEHTAADEKMSLESMIVAIGEACAAAAQAHELSDVKVTLEPGRSIVGPAGVAVYTLGATKEIAGIRTYVSVDGGMADNIRPALYGAVYSAELVERSSDAPTSEFTIAGKYCESGDVLIDRIELPTFEPGDLLAVPAAGAYCLPMASNYNMALRPAVVFVRDGESRLVQRRETFDDLLSRDIPASNWNLG